MKILVAPGAFKHSLSASATAEAIQRGLERSGLGADLHLLPVADGGNGTLDAFLANGGERVPLTVEDPLGRPVEAAYGLLDNNQTAIIEMALASGIELLTDDERDPLRASTFGTGQLLSHALGSGARRFIIGMGGSATVDGGSGCVQALGVRFHDAHGFEIPVRGGGMLDRIVRIETIGKTKLWDETEVIIASDVENPTLGPEGAATVFGPQKGASQEQVEILENNLRHYFTVAAEQLNVDVREVRGGGAAGALAAGLMVFLKGRIASGIDLLLAKNGFHDLLAEADLVITGEGQMDEQTVYGKGPIGVARLAREKGVPTIALVGGLNADDALLHEHGLQAVIPVVDKPMPLSDALARADELVERAALRVGYLLKIAQM